MQIAKGIWHFITSIKQMQKDRGMFPLLLYRVSKYEAKRHERKQHGVICLILQTPESVACS